MAFIEALGPAAVATLVCLGVGLLLLVVEMFTPGFGVAGVTGLLCLAAAIVMQYAFGDARIATYILAIVLLVLVLAILWFVRSFQRGKLSRSFLVLNDSIDAASTPGVAAAKAELIGKSGVALTALRPAGIAEIDGNRLDVMTAGAFIEKGEPVTVVNAEGMHILVRPFTPAAQAAPVSAEAPAEAVEMETPEAQR